jgi:hypothetical protein
MRLIERIDLQGGNIINRRAHSREMRESLLFQICAMFPDAKSIEMRGDSEVIAKEQTQLRGRA